jgi:hypothetical protein
MEDLCPDALFCNFMSVPDQVLFTDIQQKSGKKAGPAKTLAGSDTVCQMPFRVELKTFLASGRRLRG